MRMSRSIEYELVTFVSFHLAPSTLPPPLCYHPMYGRRVYCVCVQVCLSYSSLIVSLLVFHHTCSLCIESTRLAMVFFGLGSKGRVPPFRKCKTKPLLGIIVGGAIRRRRPPKHNVMPSHFTQSVSLLPTPLCISPF